MSIPYSDASAGDRALAQVEKVLERFGVSQFGTMKDRDAGVLRVQFTHGGRSVDFEVSYSGYAAALTRDRFQDRRERAKTNSAKSKVEAEAEAYAPRALAQAQISVCSVLRDYVKSQLVAIECGVLTFEEAFLAHILLPSGQRVVNVDAIREHFPQLNAHKVRALPGARS
jgi:hypothetical protein